MIRKDILKIDIQDNLYVLVFHKILSSGFGTAVSLYIHEHEFLKFDCFGENKGHYHIYDSVTNNTIYFDEKTCIEQINRSCYELANNINIYLNKSSRNNIREFTIDMPKFTAVIEDIRSKMIEYENTFYATMR